MALATLIQLILATTLILGAMLAVVFYPAFERNARIERRVDDVTPKRRRVRDATPRRRVQSQGGRLQDIAVSLLAYREKHLREARALLLRAGHASPNALSALLAAKLLLPIVGLLAGLLIAEVSGYDGMHRIFAAGLGLLIGLRYPEFYLGNRAKERVEAAEGALPDALDLLVICVESGLGIDQALDRVARELAYNHPILAHELALTVADLVMLPDRAQAWDNLLSRIGFQQLRNVVSVLRQAERSGSQIGPALRVVAAELRKERMLMAKQRAAKLPVKITFPLIILLLPAMFLVILGPVGLSFLDAFAQLGDFGPRSLP